MSRPLNLLIAALVIGAAPLPALAQSWPSTVVASAPRMTPASRVPALNLQREATTWVATAKRPALKLNPTSDPDEIPEVEVRAKAEWSDDQGLRVGPTRVAYKSRF